MGGISHPIDRRSAMRVGLGSLAGLALPAAATRSRAAGKTLSLLVFGPSAKSIEWLTGALAEFTKQSGFEVELRQSDWGSGFQKLLTATASGTLPDVTMMGQVMTPALTSRGAFLPIDDRLAKWADTSSYYPAMLKDGTYDGKSYCLPIYADVRTAVYRSDLLEKVGVAANALPKTWAEFKSLAEKLARKNGGPLDAPFFSLQDKSVGLMQTFSQMLYQAGGAYFDAAGKAQLGSDAGKRAIDFLVSFFKDGLANPNVVYQGTGPTPLVAGTAAMTYDGVVEQQNAIQNSPDVASKIVAGVPLTADAGGPPKTIAWINKLAISARTGEPEGAWMLLSFLASKTIASKFAELWGGLPSRTDLSDAAYLEGYSPGFSAATQYAGNLPTSPNLLQIQQQVNIALQRAIRLEAPGPQVLAELDTKIDQINGK